MTAKTLRLAQLNVGSLLEPDWVHRRDEIVAWLRVLEPDVVCFEEVWEDPNTANTAGWIADAMPETQWHWEFGGGSFGPHLWPVLSAELAFNRQLTGVDASDHAGLIVEVVWPDRPDH